MATLLLGLFNNCARLGKGSMLSQWGQNLITSQYNGGGYNGKLTFAHYAGEPVCGPGSALPESLIEIDGSQIQLFENNCSSANNESIDANEIFANPYNPFYLVHNDLIYVNQTLMSSVGPGRRVAVHALCYNPNYINDELGTYGIDFAIRFESVWNDDVGWQVTTLGHAVYGRENEAPYVVEMDGRLKETASSLPPPFQSNSGKYRLDFNMKTSMTRGSGTLRIETGDLVPVDCFHLR